MSGERKELTIEQAIEQFKACWNVPAETLIEKIETNDEIAAFDFRLRNMSCYSEKDLFVVNQRLEQLEKEKQESKVPFSSAKYKMLGMMYDCKNEHQKAYECYKEAGDDLFAQIFLNVLHFRNEQRDRAIQYFEKRKQNSRIAQYFLGNHYLHLGGTENTVRAFEYFKASDNSRSNFMIGSIYSKSPTTHEDALHYFKKSIAQGNPEAIFSLVRLCQSSKINSISINQAWALWEIAAEKKPTEYISLKVFKQHWSPILREEKTWTDDPPFVHPDDKLSESEKFKYYCKAIDSGSTEAILAYVKNIAEKKETRDYFDEIRLCAVAAAINNTSAQVKLAKFFINGLGVQKNLKNGFNFLLMAARQADVNGIAELYKFCKDNMMDEEMDLTHGLQGLRTLPDIALFSKDEDEDYEPSVLAYVTYINRSQGLTGLIKNKFTAYYPLYPSRKNFANDYSRLILADPLQTPIFYLLAQDCPTPKIKEIVETIVTEGEPLLDSLTHNILQVILPNPLIHLISSYLVRAPLATLQEAAFILKTCQYIEYIAKTLKTDPADYLALYQGKTADQRLLCDYDPKLKEYKSTREMMSHTGISEEKEDKTASELLYLGIIYFNHKDMEKAKKYFELAISKQGVNPTDPRPFDHLGALHDACGNPAEAEKNYRLAIKLKHISPHRALSFLARNANQSCISPQVNDCKLVINKH